MDERVAVFSTNFVPVSQTFVYDQVCHHARYQAEVFCWRRQYPQRFPFSPVHVAPLSYCLTRRSADFQRRFESVRFSLVHAHFATGAVYAMPYAKRTGLPLVVTFHGYDVSLYWNHRRYEPQFWPFTLHGRSVLGEMALGLCASEELRTLLIGMGVAPTKLRVHRLGVNVERFLPAEQEPGRRNLSVLAIGRLHEQKGFVYALRAFARVAPRFPGARLTIVGEGAARAALARVAKDMDIAPRIILTGAVTREEVVEHLRRADVLLAPSVVARNGERDSGLTVAKEASACAVPVVGTIHGGIPEIVEDGVTGFLVPEGDAEALAARLADLLENPDLRRRMGAAARLKMLREYDLRDCMTRLESIYDEVVVAHAGRRSVS